MRDTTTWGARGWGRKREERREGEPDRDLENPYYLKGTRDITNWGGSLGVLLACHAAKRG